MQGFVESFIAVNRAWRMGHDRRYSCIHFFAHRPDGLELDAMSIPIPCPRQSGQSVPVMRFVSPHNCAVARDFAQRTMHNTKPNLESDSPPPAKKDYDLAFQSKLHRTLRGIDFFGKPSVRKPEGREPRFPHVLLVWDRPLY